MDKYHSLFLSDNGSVYSCGFGVGGRLGHDNEEPVLVSDFYSSNLSKQMLI
jgi:alpha-tubulin suppressor-like RCC1 family protein